MLLAETIWVLHPYHSGQDRADLLNAANERTFLGYLRTGQAFAMLGVIVGHETPAIRCRLAKPTLF